MEKGDTKLIKALRKDYKGLYVKEYTTGWKEQRLIRNIELGVMSLKNTEEYISQELDKAREEGKREVYQAIVFDKNIPHDVTTFVAANLWKNMRDKAKEELSKLTTK